jgi:hypothetical protein
MFTWLKRFLGIGEPPVRPAIPEGYQAIDKKTVLASVPALHPNVERIVEKRYGCTLQWDLSEEQSKRPKRSWFPKFFFNPNRKRRHKLVLDDMGRRTVELIDGKRTVADIAAEMAKQVGCNKKAMEEAILAFVAQLARRNVVTLAPV